MMTRTALFALILALGTACVGEQYQGYDYETVADGLAPSAGTSHLLGIRGVVRSVYEQAPAGKANNFVYNHTGGPNGAKNFTGTGTTVATAAQNADADITEIYARISAAGATGTVSTETEAQANTATAPRRKMTWVHDGTTEIVDFSVDRLP